MLGHFVPVRSVKTGIVRFISGLVSLCQVSSGYVRLVHVR